MRTSAWTRSGARASTGRGPRAAGSWGASLARARAAWDGLMVAGYSATAAAAILSTALGLWADTAAALGGDDGDGLDDTAPGGTD